MARIVKCNACGRMSMVEGALSSCSGCGSYAWEENVSFRVMRCNGCGNTIMAGDRLHSCDNCGGFSWSEQ